MTESLFGSELAESAMEPARPVLPEPRRERWQPLRIGLVELFRYDSEEFWFRDGHLLLRGNNGTGKSKVLSLTLPLLFDANLRPSRVEPDGDNGKRMAWNLLLNTYQRRVGYAWIEFGRLDDDGRARYLTLGAGLSAVAGRAQVDSWYFVIDDVDGRDGQDGRRIGRDLWLSNGQRVTLSRDKLRECLEGGGIGKVFDSATAYRRAVDERLFNLGEARYEALMDTLIQLRQPQLSKKPDEAGLSQALSDSLPPLPVELLGDVAEALSQLELDREQLEQTRQLEQAVRQFEQRYRQYASVLTRRQSRELRQAQTAFDNASEARNRAQASLAETERQQVAAQRALDEARQALAVARERLDTLRSDPANQDANRLGLAQRDAEAWQREAEGAGLRCETARQALAREQQALDAMHERAEAARAVLDDAREVAYRSAEPAGTAGTVDDSGLSEASAEALADWSVARLTEAERALRDAIARRREAIRLVEKRRATVDACLRALQSRQAEQVARRAEHEDALTRRAEADQGAEAEAERLLAAWQSHRERLVALRFDARDAMAALADWVGRPEGADPMRDALADAHRLAVGLIADERAGLKSERAQIGAQHDALRTERERLAAGGMTGPSAPPTRALEARAGREGAPFWQLVEFVDGTSARERAGLEAALQSSGLLDAWVAPDGRLTGADGLPIHDVSWQARAASAGPDLRTVLYPCVPADCEVPPAIVATLLASVAYGEPAAEHDDSQQAWVAADGRFRVAALAGAWMKDEAVFIGASAREQARRRRLVRIDEEIAMLDARAAAIGEAMARLDDRQAMADEELAAAPADRALQSALLAALSAARDVVQARGRLDEAEAQCRQAEAQWQAARDRLHADASDLRLPSEADALPAVIEAVEAHDDAVRTWISATRDWRHCWPALVAQRERAESAGEALAQREAERLDAVEQAMQARQRFEVLEQSIGAGVELLRRRLREADADVRDGDALVQTRNADATTAATAYAVAVVQANEAERTLTERSEARTQSIERLRRFADSSLLSSALPDIALPPAGAAWTIDPALSLARRAEQMLQHVADDEPTWTRIQHQVSEDLGELQRALNGLGHRASAEPNDWGFAVQIVYQNRSERPDALAAYLADDVAQRSELLSAKEREVLENHLQAEIAAEIHRLMRAAEQQVDRINDELHRRPTSTGVRYRLQWLPLGVEEGGPAGLALARERLLNTSSDLWSAEDRRVVGELLQQQITDERMRGEREGDGARQGLTDQLARALDYRRWHRFGVQRLQDGQWKRLSGPASSGERALGLTVPLFAAIASFYGRGANPLAPRLMLLDEAFAGIDDAARAHCMGLIREFDLDFVITSEREWACYAELPGVSICQLLRREGVDAVYVSRWSWDGRARQRLDDPDRRFPPA
ncbi:MAG: TIGR02680 family protein [Burkholderiaceae bacterium]